MQFFQLSLRSRVSFYVLSLIVLSALSGWAQSDSISYREIPKEEILAGSADNFKLFDEAFYQNQLFLLGESHGVQKPQEVDFELLKHLNQKVGVRYYIAEVDATKAYYMNQYLKTGDDATLRKVFRSWVENKAQWANNDFFRKIQRIRALNQTLPANRQIQFVGIDRIHDNKLVAEHLTQLIQGKKLPKASQPLADSLMQRLGRPFADRREDEPAGAWVAGGDVDRAKPFACLVKESDLYLHDKVVSITFSYLDSYSMVPTAYLPPFWQDKGKTYTRLDKFNQDSELMHTEGIDAMRAATRPNSLTLFALDRPGSFARKTPIRIKYAPYMPKTQQMQFDPAHPTTDYFQYVILVRNSDMTEPMEP